MESKIELKIIYSPLLPEEEAGWMAAMKELTELLSGPNQPIQGLGNDENTEDIIFDDTEVKQCYP